MWSLALLTSVLALIQAVNAAPTTTTRDRFNLPTSVGHQGTFTTGAVPFLAQTDNVAIKTGAPTRAFEFPQPIETALAQAYNHNASQDNIFEYMGVNSPYYVSSGWGVYDYALPDQCTIEQVVITQRHGSRYPALNISSLPHTLRNAGDFQASGNLSFLTDWTYELGVNQLTTLGNQQLFDKGVKNYFRYGGLYDFNTEKLFTRTTSEEMMLQSAEYFLTGYFGFNWPNYVDLEVIIEDQGFNNSLAPYTTCTNYNRTLDIASNITDPLIETYLLSAARRLNRQLDGLNLTTSDLYDMQTLCAYETNTLGYSKFCPLFSQNEWEWYGYIQDINLYYTSSFGNPTAKAQGIGLVTELYDRITGTEYSRSTQSTQNSTLDSDSTYFPLNKTMYVDFTHDTTIVNMLTALGFQQFNTSFNLEGPRDNATFKASQIVPYGAQLTFEIIHCNSSVPDDRASQSNGNGETSYVHAILNDHSLSLSQNIPDFCDSRVDGWCRLSDFTDYLRTLYRRSNFNHSCFGTYDYTRSVSGGVPASSRSSRSSKSSRKSKGSKK